MKQIFSLFYLLIIVKSLQSQEIKNYDFVGTLQLNNHNLITYKLSFIEIGGGNIEGSSITDLYGKDRTEAKIKGKYNSATQKISFYETQNVNTKSNTQASEFCFVHVTNAAIKTVKGKTIIQSSFIGKYQNGKNCASGYLYLMGATDLDDMSKQIMNSKQFKNADSLQLIKQKIEAFTKRTGIAYLQKNEEFSVISNTNEMQLQVWDGGREIDKDEISIFVNGEILFEKLEISGEKKTITIPLNEPKRIKILAISEGISAPCTINFLVKNEDATTPIIASLKKGEHASIFINKK